MIVVAWNEDRIAQLKSLWKDGLSAAQIANELGGITRNAVIGKAHRLGLSKRAEAKPARIRSPKRTAHYLRQVNKPRFGRAHVPAAVMPLDDVPELTAEIVSLHQRLSLVELSDAVCHWPIGDPGDADFAFCGGKAWTGTPYCAHHGRIAYIPASERRRSSASVR